MREGRKFRKFETEKDIRRYLRLKFTVQMVNGKTVKDIEKDRNKINITKNKRFHNI